MTQGRDPDAVDFVFGLIVLSLLMFGSAVVAYKAADKAWKGEALKHGAAVYVLEENRAVFKWKDEVKE